MDIVPPCLLYGVRIIVGVPGIEPGLHAPKACVQPVYYTPNYEQQRLGRCYIVICWVLNVNFLFDRLF